MVNGYYHHMHANRQMKQNVIALLKGRHLAQKDLADYCRKSESWISKILQMESTREFPLKYWDRIADFFGISTYQLLQPGISSVTERRKGDRRSGQERRVSRKPENAHARAGFTDQALIREVLSVPFDERPFLFESIAALKRRRVEWPTRGQFGAGPVSSGESAPPVPRGPSPRTRRHVDGQ
jgi:transcriptional regulator with XRE-family HTH domain